MEQDRRGVLVAGGTGFLGSAFVRELCDAGRRVVVLTRDPSKLADRFPGRDVEGREGDVTRPATLEGALDDVSVVVQSVQFPGFPVERPSRGHTFREVDGRGTANVAAEASRAGVDRMVYLSGVGADPDSEKPWFRAKAMAERAVREGAFAHSIVRPSWVYGPGDRSLNLFARMIRWTPGVFVQLGDGEQRLNPVFVGDVAAAVAAEVERPDGADVLFEIGGPVTYTMDGVVRVLMDVLGRRKPIVHVPKGLARAGAAVAELVPGRPMSRSAVEFVTQGAVADLGTLREVHPDLQLTVLQDALSSYFG